MDPTLVVALAWTAGATVTLAALLIIFKLVHREILRWRGVRTAHYVAAIGELVSRGMVLTQPPSAWSEDPYFHHALAEYRLLVTGPDRETIDGLANALGIHEVLEARSRNRLMLTARLRAVSSLVDLADERHIDTLRKLVHDRNSHVRVHAVRGLARLGDAAYTTEILNLAKTVKPWEAARIADALVDLGSSVVDPIVQWVTREMEVDRPDVEVISLATRILGLIGDPDAEPTLLRLLGTDQPELRLAAASALEHTGGEAAVPALLEALDDRDWKVRARVAVALGATAEPTVARPVSGLLNDPVWWVRQNAAAALGSIPAGTDYLIAALEGFDPYAADAALNQLTVSGVLRQVLDRVSGGEATDRDLQLASLVSDRP